LHNTFLEYGTPTASSDSPTGQTEAQSGLSPEVIAVIIIVILLIVVLVGAVVIVVVVLWRKRSSEETNKTLGL